MWCSAIVLVFILLPLIQMFISPSVQDLKVTIQDADVLRAIWLSIYTAALASLISFAIGTPFAYLLAQKNLSRQKNCGKYR